MDSIISFISEVFINIVEVGLFFYFITHQLNIKPNCKKFIPLSLAALVIIVTVFNYFSINVYFSMLFFLSSQIILTFLLMQGRPTEKFLWGCFYEIIDFVSEGLTFFILSFLTTASASDLTSKYPERYVLISVYILLLTTFVLILTRNKKESFVLPYWLLGLFFILVIIGIVAIESLLGLVIELPGSSPESYFLTIYMVITIFLLVFAFLIALIIYLSRLYQNNLKLIETTQQKIIEESQLSLISNTVQTLRTWKHDSRHYISVLERLIDSGKYEDASNYIHDLSQSYEKSSWEVFTGNSIIDAVISTKSLLIRQKGFRFSHSIFLLPSLPFDSISLSSLMGNMFDNAIEACSKITDHPEPYIDLTIRPYHDSLHITMENSCNGEYSFSQEHSLMTTKDAPNHGIGLKRIKDIAEEAGGYCHIKPGKDNFHINLVIPIKYK